MWFQDQSQGAACSAATVSVSRYEVFLLLQLLTTDTTTQKNTADASTKCEEKKSTNWQVCHYLWVSVHFQTKNKLLWVATWPGAKTAALPSFSDKTSALSGDKQKPWRDPEEEATQITTATIQGFGGARESRGHCLALVSFFLLLLKLFLGCGWHFSDQRRGKNTSNVSCKVFLLVSFV